MTEHDEGRRRLLLGLLAGGLGASRGRFMRPAMPNCSQTADATPAILAQAGAVGYATVVGELQLATLRKLLGDRAG